MVGIPNATFYDKLKNPKTEAMVDKIAEFWQENKLGRIKVEKLEPLTLRAYDCFECEDLPKIGRSACAFDSGYLKPIFQPIFPKMLMWKRSNALQRVMITAVL